MDQPEGLLTKGLLDGLTVIDLGVGMAPALVAKFLADNGARVRRIEPTAGDPFHDYYPAYSVWRAGAEKLGPEHLEPGRLDTLLAQADACILGGEDYPGLAPLVSADELARRHPGLVLLDITGNPHGVAGAERPSTDLLAQARSGLCFEQYTKRPVAMAFEPASYGAALQGLCALLGALCERGASGRGQVARTSLVQGSLTWVSQLWGQFDRPSAAASALQPKDLTPLIFRCADGVYVHLAIGPPGTKYKLYQVLGIDDPSVKPEDLGMPKFGDGDLRNFFGDIDLLSAHVARFDSNTLLEACWREGLVAEPVLNPGQCWDHPQIARNGIVARTPDGVRHVGNPVIATGSPAKSRTRIASGPAALSGVRAIDFGAYVAGPLATVMLTDLGADVIKVEALTGDSTRAMMRSYLAANRGKRGLALDLRSREGAQAAHELASAADVVTNNFRGGVSAKLGIDPVTLHALKPDLITLESPGYGAAGPLAARGAFDPAIQAFCGHEIKAAGEGNEPFWNRTYMVDFAGGMLGAVSILTALCHRARTGNGVALEAPLLNAGVFLLSEVIQQPDGQFSGMRPLNAGRTGYSPYEAMYEAADGWIAIVARGGEAQARLLSALQVAPGDGIADRIATAVRGRRIAELASELEPLGVWTERCRDDAEASILNDPEFAAIGAVRASFHPEFGAVREIGPLFTLSRSQVGTATPIHGLGEHTRQVLTDCGAAPHRIDALLKSGAAHQAPAANPAMATAEA